MINRMILIAPMMDCTDRHFRVLMRLISQQVLLYTEMITTGAIIHGDRDYLLGYDASEHPIALQLGGSDPKALAESAKIAQDWGYDEINLNVGCPSDRVQAGRFGACLMKEPILVAECVAAMRAQVNVPVTVKTRLGVDDQDSYPLLVEFVHKVKEAGCQTFILHARKAWLKGLSPKENRDVPPLRYDVVYQLKRDFPDLEIIINGGVKSQDEIAEHLQYVDGVMIGREAYAHPYQLMGIDQRFYLTNQELLSRQAVISKYVPYMMEQLARGVSLRHLTKNLIGIFQGQPGARKWRQMLSEPTMSQLDGMTIITKALEMI